MTKILLVEDDNNLRDIYQARLQAEGYDISSAQDGEEALVVAKQVKPDLVISDVMMPKISGFEMLDILRNTDGLGHVKVIMLTALGQAEDRTRAGELGADKYLVKSQVTLEDIVKTVHELLDSDGGGSTGVGTIPTVDPTATATVDSSASTATTPTPPPGQLPSDSPAALSMADEEAAMQAQIDNFSQGAATTPAAADPVAAEPADPVAEEPAAPSSPTSDVAMPAAADPVAEPPADPVATDSTDSQTDDKLMTDAVNQLSGADSAEAPAEAEEPVAAPETAEAKPADDATQDSKNKHSDTVGIAGKKVIKPITHDEKPSLDELLAKETAAEEATTSQTGQVVTSDSTPKADDSTEDKPGPDPNSIAL